MTNLISKTGKTPKKGIKGVGRPKKKVEISKEEYDKLSKEQLIEIIEYLRDIVKDTSANTKLKKINLLQNSSISKRLFAKVLNISKSLLYRKIVSKKIKPKNRELSEIENVVLKAFTETKAIFGRERLSIYIHNKHKMFINSRTLGRIMNKLCLKCLIRRKRKSKEIKNTNVKYVDLVKRDYNAKNNEIIIATDVSYISAPKDVDNNFV
ncbi:hypothetical protein FJO69_02960, partial [[Mycoplasma] falconis]